MNLTHAESINALWANLLVEELLRHGIDRFILSPGSRCAPLTAAIARNPKAVSTVHFDERGAGFFAGGYAKAAGRAAVLVCTSGTAAANYYPAIVEASMSMTPLLVMTADRPPELHNIGANQTIDQQRLYGGFVREEIQMPCPDSTISPGFVLSSIDRAVAHTWRSVPGPVHINLPFREPLAPLGPTQDFAEYLKPVDGWVSSKAPLQASDRIPLTISDAELKDIANDLSAEVPGILVVGPLADKRETYAVRELADHLGWPLFADIRSGLRLGTRTKTIVTHFDQLFLRENLFLDHEFKILHIGGVLTSKRYYQFLENARIKSYVMVGPDPRHSDPSGRVTRFIRADIVHVADELRSRLDKTGNSDFASEMARLNCEVGKVIASTISQREEINEIAAARIISEEIGSGDVLWLGSSMPIRDMDMYAVSDGREVSVGANRGASGIDGSIASFLGFVDGADCGGTTVIGDLAALHDLNSLALVRDSRHPVTIVVINNDGGGIFSFLPIAECDDVFEAYFGTPHGLSLEHGAILFNLEFRRVTTATEFKQSYHAARQSKKSTLIEVRTTRKENIALHRRVQDEIKRTLEKQ